MIDTGKTLRYPVGIQTFSEIREGGYLYIDKTAYIHKLICMGKYYFLSRPRRFGKSLLLSTIEAYYQGRRDLFKGLAIESLTDKWEPYPVLHLDLNARKYSDSESLIRELDRHLSIWEDIYGNDKRDKDVEERFSFVIESAFRKTGKQVVILVDEYDKPLLNAINDEALSDSFRSTLKAFYGNLKSMDRYIKLAVLTGVARFSKVSIFSDLNNLADLSFRNDFSAICGITASEVDEYFKTGIAKLAETNGMEVDEARRKLKENYDGYHFCAKSEDIYNPFSLMNVFMFNEFDNYWANSGSPTFLVKLLLQRRTILSELSEYHIERQRLHTEGILTHNPIAALYQSGYLTIKRYEPDFSEYVLDFPNREVKQSFFQFLQPYYTGEANDMSEFSIRNFVKEVLNGHPEDFMCRLGNFISSIPYPDKDPAPESFFQNAIYTLFTLMGFYTRLEDRTIGGRIDAEILTDKYIYIIEIKIDSSANEAMAQIKRKKYWQKFMSSGKTVYLIGANFISSTLTLDEPIIERLD